MNEESEYKKYLEIIKKVFIPGFYKETLLSRSITWLKKEFNEFDERVFKKEVFNAITDLYKKADECKLKNTDIRKEIKKIQKKSKSSIGQSQKIINVYLKYYCILREKWNSIEELDCPLDSQIMGKYSKKEYTEKTGKKVKKTALYKMDWKNYENWQDHLDKIAKLEKKVRIYLDIETYDKDSIDNFLNSKK